jgi:hypothetical protein
MHTTVGKTNATGSNPINELIGRVMDKFDTNKDKQLDANEFGAFLRGCLDSAAVADSDADVDAGDKLDDAVKASVEEFNPATASWDLLHGFSAQNYYDKNMNTMKYQFARIAADYDPRQPGALERLVKDPRFTAVFPNARLVGKDSIDFGGQLSEGGGRGVPVGLVDVGEAFVDTMSGPAWQWLDQSNA